MEKEQIKIAQNNPYSRRYGIIKYKCVINVVSVNFDQNMNLKLMKMWSLTRVSLM